MNLNKTPQSIFHRSRTRPVLHWKNSKELYRVMHSLPGYFKAILIEMIERPMTRKELGETVENLETRLPGRRKRKLKDAEINRDIDFAVNHGLLEIMDDKYLLTPGGRELAQCIKDAVPLFFNSVLSVRMVSIITIIIHVLLSVVKLAFGIISQSAGLIADGIDNTVDTISSVLVWIGIKHKKDRIVALVIIILMVISCFAVVITGIDKLRHPTPVKEGISVFIVSAISGVIMLLLSAYQYITGKRRSNFAIICQSVDSRNHFLTSLLVCLGILSSYIAGISNQSWLYYSDGIVALIIGILIAKSFFELILEFLRPEREGIHISHFVERSRRNMEKKIVFRWLSEELKNKSRSYDDLLDRFQKQFCQATPEIFSLTGFGYLPKTGNELRYFLDKFLRNNKLILKDGRYSLSQKMGNG